MQPTAIVKLSLEEELCLVLRDQLFGGSWRRMEQDLRDRQTWCHPSHAVDRQVNAELARIRRLRQLEASRGNELAGMRSLAVEGR